MLGAAKDGSDLAQDVAVDVLGAAKNGSVKVFIVKVFILLIHTLAPQAAPRVEPEFPLSL